MIFADGKTCNTLSEQFKRLKYVNAVYNGDIILTSDSIKGSKTLTSSMPDKPKHHVVARVDPALLSAIPKEDPGFKEYFKTCAIVGSSGNMLNYENGREIDKHDLVFRFNSAPTKGFEKHVGRKTTHRLTNSRNFAYREYRTEIVLVHTRTDGSVKYLVSRKRKRPAERLYGLHPNWYKYSDRTFKILATSGLTGILIGLHRCHRIDIYGFHVAAQHGALYHYYNKNDKPANVQRDGVEWFIVKELADNGFLHFKEPCILECHETLHKCKECQKKHVKPR